MSLVRETRVRSQNEVNLKSRGSQSQHGWIWDTMKTFAVGLPGRVGKLKRHVTRVTCEPGRQVNRWRWRKRWFHHSSSVSRRVVSAECHIARDWHHSTQWRTSHRHLHQRSSQSPVWPLRECYRHWCRTESEREGPLCSNIRGNNTWFNKILLLNRGICQISTKWGSRYQLLTPTCNVDAKCTTRPTMLFL